MRIKIVTLAFILSIFTLVEPAFGHISPHQFSDTVRKLDLSVADTRWDFFEGDDSTSKTAQGDLDLQFVARAPSVPNSQTQPTLTLRVDKGDYKSARAYSEKWLKEFPKFGYELQMSKDSKYGSLNGFDMELRSTVSNRRVRQFVVNGTHEMWVFTCSSEDSLFKDAWKSCEKILNTARLH